MHFKDQIAFVRQHIRKNKMRVFMTVLAATMGTSFLIVLASIGFGIHDTLREEMLEYSLVTEIRVHEKDDGEKPEANTNALHKIEHVRAVIEERTVQAGQQIALEDYQGWSQLVLSNFKEKQKVGFELAKGQFPKAPNEVVVGHHFHESLEKQQQDEIIPYEDTVLNKKITYHLLDEEGEPIGKPIQLKIVGIEKAPKQEWMQDHNVYGDIALAAKLQQQYDAQTKAQQSIFYTNVTVHADQLENVSAVSEEIKALGFYTYSVSDELEQLDFFFLALKAGLIFVGTIAILIASIGIFNTMTMAVTERTREIGVMKSLGATPQLIQRLFIMESAWIGVVGTVLAVVISYVVSTIANFVLPIIVTAALGEEDLGDIQVTFSVIPWQLIVIASTISIGVAIVSGWRPARKATKTDIIQALRQEL